MEHLSVRPATVNDVPAIAEISRSTFYDTYHAYNTARNMQLFLGEHFSEREILDELKQPAISYLLVFGDAQLAGYAKLQEGVLPIAGGEAALEISRLYCRLSSIGKGTGAFLMDHCLAVARERGLFTVWLNVWERNDRAIRFYEKKGFIQQGNTSFLFGEEWQNDRLMVKNL
jgi:ribosomal protein S18 acetylase RimI-like enzyme